MEAEAVSEKAEIKPKERIAYFDNAKLILIFLVVLGHFFEHIPNNKIIFAIYDFIYLFHIPAFVLIAGYFSKNTTSLLKRIVKYAILYFVFSLYYLPASFNTSIPFLLNPYWIMWYLISLISWNLLLIPFKKNKFSVLIAFIIGIAAGYITFIGNILSLSRTFVFFPFFLIGYYLKKDFLKAIKFKTRIIAFLILIAILYLSYIYQIPPQWLYGSTSYIKLGITEWYAGLVRLWVYSISALTCICVLILIPTKRFKITYIGENTLNVYVLHGIFVVLIRDLVIFQNASDITKIIISCCFAVLLVALLSSKIVGRTTNYVIGIFTKFLAVCKNAIIAKFQSTHEKS